MLFLRVLFFSFKRKPLLGVLRCKRGSPLSHIVSQFFIHYIVGGYVVGFKVRKNLWLRFWFIINKGVKFQPIPSTSALCKKYLASVLKQVVRLINALPKNTMLPILRSIPSEHSGFGITDVLVTTPTIIRI